MATSDPAKRAWGGVSFYTHSRQLAEFPRLGVLHILSQLSAHRDTVTGPPAHKWKAAGIFIPSLAVS